MADCRTLVYVAICAVWHVGVTLGQSQIDVNILTRLENLEKQVSGQHNQLEAQTKLIADLQTRITNQESAIANQQATINEQQTTIEHQQQTISQQQREISEQQSNLAEQGRRLAKVEDILTLQKTTKGEKSNEANSVHGNHLEQDVTNIKRGLNPRLVLDGYEGPVAFHAVNSMGVVKHTGPKVLFPTVMLNLGSGYHTNHSVFMAPAEGVYMFSTTIFSYDTHKPVPVSILKNGVVLARAYAFNSNDLSIYAQGSVTIVAQLAAGDEVWVGQYGNSGMSYYGDFYTSFMGYLLWRF